jgi:DNA polymerase-1
MAGLAAISNDTQLAYDINHGVDMHEQLYKEMYGRLPTKDERKKFKSLSFGLVYGAGARTLADNAGCSVADAKRFIDVFYSRYKGVGEFHTSIQKEAAKGRKLTTGHTPKGEPIGAYLKRMPTGRMYLFHEYDNEWKGGATFSPTELKNWPVQGFATGDIVPHMVGHLVKQMYQAGANEYALPIMTVHDSIVFDVKQESLDKFIKAAKIVLSNTTPIFERHYGITMPVKLSVGCSFGPTWGDQVEYDLSSI